MLRASSCLLSCLVATGCVHVTTSTVEHTVELPGTKQSKPTGGVEVDIQTKVEGDRIGVQVREQAMCSATDFRRWRVDFIDTKEVDETPFWLQTTGAAVLTVAGAVFLATSGSRPDIDDRYSRDELSSQGALGIGATSLAAGLALASGTIRTHLRTGKTTVEGSPEQEPKETQTVACGEESPAEGQIVELHLATRAGEIRRSKTSSTGTAYFELSKEDIAELKSPEASVHYRTEIGIVDLRELASYDSVQTAKREELAKEVAEREALNRQMEAERALKAMMIGAATPDPSLVRETAVPMWKEWRFVCADKSRASKAEKEFMRKPPKRTATTFVWRTSVDGRFVALRTDAIMRAQTIALMGTSSSAPVLRGRYKMLDVQGVGYVVADGVMYTKLDRKGEPVSAEFSHTSQSYDTYGNPKKHLVDLSHLGRSKEVPGNCDAKITFKRRR